MAFPNLHQLGKVYALDEDCKLIFCVLDETNSVVFLCQIDATNVHGHTVVVAVFG